MGEGDAVLRVAYTTLRQAAEHTGGHSNFNIYSICPKCYQIAHIAPSAISPMHFVMDNLGDPELFPVGVFESLEFRL